VQPREMVGPHRLIIAIPGLIWYDFDNINPI
jgi:hypothetical protein